MRIQDRYTRSRDIGRERREGSRGGKGAEDVKLELETPASRSQKLEWEASGPSQCGMSRRALEHDNADSERVVPVLVCSKSRILADIL